VILRHRCNSHPRLAWMLSLGFAVPLFTAVASSDRAAEVNVTNDLTRRYGEVQIAVNPKNPNNIVYADVQLAQTAACKAAKDPDCEVVPTKLIAAGVSMAQPRGFFTRKDFDVVGLFVSFDRGKTWRRTTVPLPSKEHPRLTGWGDPSVAVTPDGTFYLSFDNMDWGTPEDALPAGGIAVSKSTDGGKTWSSPVLTGTPLDGPKMVADPNTGTIYEASSSVLGPLATGDPATPRGAVRSRWLTSSKDGVKWTEVQPMGGNAHMSAAHGMLAAVFKTGGENLFSSANNDLCGSAPSPCVLFQTTKDAGATWTRHVMPVPATANRPMVAADPSKQGHFTVAAFMNGDKEFQVYETRDSGESWSKPVTVVEDNTKRHFHAWIAYSPSGVLGMMWRTSQAGPAPAAVSPTPAGPMPYNVWAAISRDGGATFSETLQVSGDDSPAGLPGASGDDYSSIVLDREYVYVGWPDWRPGERQGYFRAINFSEFKFKH
jgi:hypothetical protein